MKSILFIIADLVGWVNVAIGVVNLLVVVVIAIINYLILEKFNNAQREFEEITRRLNLKPDIRLEYYSFNPNNNHVGFWVINNGKKAKDIEFNIVSGKIKGIHANKNSLE